MTSRYFYCKRESVMKREIVLLMCIDLAWALWRSMDAEYKRRYALKVWEQFQERLAGEAMTTTRLGEYVNSVCSKLGVQQLGGKDDIARIDEILNAGADRDILRLMRDETALIVVKVRLLNEQRKAEYEKWRKEHPTDIEQEEELIKAWEEFDEQQN